MSARFLSDAEVVLKLMQDEIVLSPLLSTDQIGMTIDLRLGTEFVVKKMDRLTHLDPVDFHRIEASNPQEILGYYDSVKIVDPLSRFVLHPGQFALGCTLEFLSLPSHIGGLLEGRSSWAREGLNVHSTAGIIHPGHRGIIVFELMNAGTHPIPLHPGIRVAQLLLYELDNASIHPYGPKSRAKYSRFVATNFGRPWEDWEFGVLSRKLRGKAKNLRDRYETEELESSPAVDDQGRSTREELV